MFASIIFWLKTGQGVDVNDGQNFIYRDEDPTLRWSRRRNFPYKSNGEDNNKKKGKIYSLYISFFDDRIQLFKTFFLSIFSNWNSIVFPIFFFFSRERESRMNENFSRIWLFTRPDDAERIKRRLKGDWKGAERKIARTQAHLNGRYTLRWRTCTCVLRLHSFARSLGSSVYLAAKHIHTHT